MNTTNICVFSFSLFFLSLLKNIHDFDFYIVFCLFGFCLVCLCASRSGKQFFNHVGTEPPLPGYYQYFFFFGGGEYFFAQGNNTAT